MADSLMVYAINAFQLCNRQLLSMSDTYIVGSKSFRPGMQKVRQMENAVRDI